MAKRYSSESRWKLIRKLSPEFKLAYMYINDACDHAGVWAVDLEMLKFQTGVEIFTNEFELATEGLIYYFSHKGVKYWFVMEFLNEQYNGELNETNKVHLSVMKILERMGLMKEGELIDFYEEREENVTPSIPHSNPIETPIIGYIDKEKEKDNVKLKGRKRSAEEKEGKQNSEYSEGMDIYFEFIKEQTGAPPKIDGGEGKALKSIIKYLNTLESVKTEQKTSIEVFDYILKNWEDVEPFHQKQLKLVQINSNLINIIGGLKNGKRTVTASKQSELSRSAAILRGKGF